MVDEKYRNSIPERKRPPLPVLRNVTGFDYLDYIAAAHSAKFVKSHAMRTFDYFLPSAVVREIYGVDAEVDSRFSSYKSTDEIPMGKDAPGAR